MGKKFIKRQIIQIYKGWMNGIQKVNLKSSKKRLAWLLASRDFGQALDFASSTLAFTPF